MRQLSLLGLRCLILLLCVGVLLQCSSSTSNSNNANNSNNNQPPDRRTPVVDVVRVTSDGKVAVVFSREHKLESKNLLFRFRVKDKWWDTSSFETPISSKEGDTITITWSGKDASPLSKVQCVFRTGVVNQLRLMLSVTPRQSGVVLTAFAINLPQGSLGIPEVQSKMYWLHQGHQSWSFTGAVLLEAPFASPGLKDEPLLAKGSKGDPIDETKGISWWMGMAAGSPNGPAIALGATHSERWRTVVLPSLVKANEPSIEIRQGTSGDPILLEGETSLEPLVFATGSNPGVAMQRFASIVEKDNPRLPEKSPVSPMGWWSWNVFFDGVTAQQVLDNADIVKKSLFEQGFKLIELDDGYQTKWGMWESIQTDKFPGGLESLAEKLKARGFQQGIWLAPFLVDTSTSLAKDNPDWFVKGEDGKPLVHRNAGQSFSSYILDPTNPAVKDHLTGLFQRLAKLGYVWFKLDFLFTGAFQGKRKDPNITGVEALRLGLDIIHKAAPQAHINLCGMPFWPGIGRGHSIRYGPDIAFKGLNPGFKLIAHEARNSMLRGPFYLSLRNDPDQVLAREPLSLGEARVAATLGALTGFYTLGDDLTKLKKERMELVSNPTLIEIAKFGQSAVPLDWFAATGDVIVSPVVDLGANDTPMTAVPSQYFLKVNEKTAYLGLFNWTDKAKSFSIQPTMLLKDGKSTKDVWNNKDIQSFGTVTLEVPSHDVILLKLSAP